MGAGVAVLGAFGAASVSAAASFEQWTQRLVNGAQESSANLEMIRQGVLQVSTDVGISIGKLSDATYFIESAGLHGADALKVLSVSAKAARIDMADVSTVAQALTTVMHIYGDSNELAAARAGQLIQIVGLGKTTLETFSAAFGNIGVTAATLHVPFEQLGAMIDIDTKYSLDAAMATTGLRFGLAALASETPKGTKALAELGLTSNQVAQQMLTQGPVPVLELIKQRMDELGVSEAEQIRIEKAIFGGTRGWQGLLAVINNLPEANEMIKTIGNTTQATDEFTVHWQSTLKETTTQAGRLKAELGQVATEAGGVLLPAVSFATEVIANGIAADIKQVHALGDAFIWLAKFTTGIDISGPPPAPAASGVQFGPPMPTDVRFGPPMPTADQIAAQAKVDAQNAYNKALADTKALTDSYAGQSLKHLQSQQQAITANLDQQRSAMAALRSQMDAAKTAGDDVNAKALSDQIVGLNGHMEDEQSKLEAVNSAMASVRSTTDLTA
ncbi:MAG TPA: phage tail tape measure protein, partial [Chloroflexota bacterium]